MSPSVGGKHFSYTAKGRAAAKAESARTGKPVKMASPAAAAHSTKDMPMKPAMKVAMKKKMK